MKTVMVVHFLLATLISWSCSKEPINSDPPGEKSGSKTVNKTQMLRLVNEVRAKGCQCGDTWYNPVAPITWNDQLEKAALAHSNDMLTRQFFSHISPEGNNAGERIELAGYNWAAFGENIGMGYKDEAEVVAAWKSSPSHCKNIMNGNYREMGVGRAGIYWTQNFAKR